MSNVIIIKTEEKEGKIRYMKIKPERIEGVFVAARKMCELCNGTGMRKIPLFRDNQYKEVLCHSCNKTGSILDTFLIPLEDLTSCLVNTKKKQPKGK